MIFYLFLFLFRRGLLLPKMVIEEFGVELTEEKGLLGSGIYFGDEISTSIKYSKASKVKGTRLLLISDVALGKVKEFISKETSLKEPPEGFDSVQGIGRHQDSLSSFQVSHLNNSRKNFLVFYPFTIVHFFFLFNSFLF